MRIIIPMAGMGKRMRPHTLIIPKPLFPIAGKPIVQRLVEDIAEMIDQPIEEICFIIGDFGKEVENDLIQIGTDIEKHQKGIKPEVTIYYQEEPLGTAHAILCAKDSLKGNVIVAFADTLFKADFKLDTSKDGIIWVHKVDNPSSFGVVKVDDKGIITDFVEKPDDFVSDLAIIGIYYFKDGAYLKDELQFLIDNDHREKGEFHITNALENMKNKKSEFLPGKVEEWLDCGNKEATLATNQRILELNRDNGLINKSATIENVKIIEPCYIGPNCSLKNVVLGPNVSIEENTQIESSIIDNSIIQKNSIIKKAILGNSIIGNHVIYSGTDEELSLGDYTTSNEG